MDAYRPRKTQYDKTLETIAGIKDRELREADAAEKKENNSIFESAKFSHNAAVARRLAAKRNAVLESQYDGRVAEIGLEFALAEAASRALPLDHDEYSKLNPKYVTEIYESICDAFKGPVSTDNLSPAVKVILEGIRKAAPEKSEGILMEDKSLHDKLLMSLQDDEDVNKAIDSLSAGVRDNVAGIVANDQKEADQINGAIDDIKTAKDIAAEKAQQDQLAQQQAADQQSAQDAAAAQQAQADDPATYDPNYVADPNAAAAQPDVAQQWKDVSVTVGGTTITVHNESYAKNAPVRGIVEALSLKESLNMLDEGKDYNADLALANAIKTITVLETLNASGLVHVGHAGYARLLENIGKTSACKSKIMRRQLKEDECEDDTGKCAGEPVKTIADIAAEKKAAGNAGSVAGFPDGYFATKSTYSVRKSNGYDAPADPNAYISDGGAPAVSTEAGK